MRRSLIIGILVAAACGGEATDETGTSGAGSTSGATSTPTSSGSTGSTGSAGTTSTGTTTGVTTGSTGGETTSGETTTGGTTSTTSGETTGTTGTTGEASSSEEGSSTGETTGGGEEMYAAMYFAGGLDRILVRKANMAEDLCTSIMFVWPSDGDPPGFAVGLPAMWGVQSGTIHQGAAGCLQFMPPPMATEFAETGLGSATWEPNLGCPPTLDIDLSLGFAVNMPWVPDQDILQATEIPVQGC